MDTKEQKYKICKLFNKMQNLFINFDQLVFPNLYIAFDLYKIHIDTLSSYLEGNTFGKLCLSLFRELFEENNNFKEYNEEKAEYLNILINAMTSKDKMSNSMIIDKKIINILSEQKNDLLRKLIKILKCNFKIKRELYYILFVYLKVKGFLVNDLIEYLEPILKENYPESTIDFSGVIQSNISFNEFIKILDEVFRNNDMENYMILKFDIITKNIILEKKSLDEVLDIISSKSDNKAQKVNINKTIKSKNIKNNDMKDGGNFDKNKDGYNGKKTNGRVENEKSINNIDSTKEKIKELNSEKNSINKNKENNDNDKIKQDKDKKDNNSSEKEKIYEDFINIKIEKINEEWKKKFNEINKKYEEIKKENNEIKNENKILNDKIEQNKEKNSNLSIQIMQIKKEIIELKYILKNII